MHASKAEAKGILLAGGSGSRLAPMTDRVSKQLLPVHDKPMIYYPLATLMQAGVREILIISTPDHLSDYQQLFASGKELGIEIEYAIQDQPRGLPQAITIGADFIGEAPVVLLLGDNIFLGGQLTERIAVAAQRTSGATLFAIKHHLANQYGIVELGPEGQILSLEEKPDSPKSDLVITGAYVFDPQVVAFARSLQPSQRGETEMIDLLDCYRGREMLRAELLTEDTVWFDAGTPQTLRDAAEAVADAQTEQCPLGSPQDIARVQGWI